MKENYPRWSWSNLCVPVCLRADSDEKSESIPKVKKSRSLKEYLLSGATEEKTGGLRAIYFVLANESFERFATFGLFANFTMYLTKIYHLEKVSAANVVNIWFALTNFLPLVGAFLADAYWGRFWTIGFSSFFSLLGMITVTLTAGMPSLHPPSCSKTQLDLGHCIGPTNSQMGALILGLALLSIGSGGIRPCSIPFGVDQYDITTDQGRKGITSFFNWYYGTFTIVVLIAQTVILYIQDQISWTLGLAIPTSTMVISIFLFFYGARFYNHVKPEGSPFTGIAQVVVAAYKKRRLKIENDVENDKFVYYDPPAKANVLVKLARTYSYRCLEKAAVITSESEVARDGTPTNKWRLTSIQNVEELKCVVRIFPIWACGMISLTAMTQQWSFNVYQADIMDRHMGKFIVPPGTVASVISLITVVTFLPIYDRVLVPALRRVTGIDSGITLLQRIGIGIVFSVASMAVAGTVERIRRTRALAGAPNMSAFWLTPHLILMGFCEAFSMIGQIEFFNRQFPEHMRSVGNALFPLSFGFASYISTMVLNIVKSTTKSKQFPKGWLDDNLNHGRYDYYYFILAGLGVANLALFLFCANRFRYKEINFVTESDTGDVEMSDKTQDRKA